MGCPQYWVWPDAITELSTSDDSCDERSSEGAIPIADGGWLMALSGPPGDYGYLTIENISE
jgi:hypothetical protein